jgi:hypothetical protein
MRAQSSSYVEFVTGCTGCVYKFHPSPLTSLHIYSFDNAWIDDNNTGTKPAFSVWSKNSGIRMDVTTNQQAIQVYTCNGIFNSSLPIPRKASQGGKLAHYTKHSCFVFVRFVSPFRNIN